MRILAGAAAGVGAYYSAGSLVMAVAAPFRYKLPIVGQLYYEPQISILALVTFLGTVAAGAVAFSYGRMSALAAVALLQVALAMTVIAPVAGQPAAWAPPPPDIDGVTTAFVLLASVLVAAPGICLGLLIGSRMPAPGARWVTLLAAAGAYYLACVVMSLPTPQLDLRMALPYSAGGFTGAWRAVVVAVPALVAGTVLGCRGVGPVTSAIYGAAFGLAGALPSEILVMALGTSPYIPVAAVGVPIATAAITGGVAITFGRIPQESFLRFIATPKRAAVAGFVVAVAAFVTWSLLAAMPTSADHDARIDAYRESGDERKIIACVTSGRGEQLRSARAREDASSATVTITLRRDPSWYFYDLVGIPLPVIVPLREPLGARAVVDGSTGERVRGLVLGTNTTTPFFC